jgi:hypothetical protein
MSDGLNEQAHAPSEGTDSEANGAGSDQDSLAGEAADVLYELFTLLNEYAPSWYTERHHMRARKTLAKMGKL